MSTSSLKKVAVVTGASSGIGAAYADRLAQQGYDLVLVARRTDRLKTLSERISRQYGVNVELITADLTNPAELATVEHLLANNPAVDLLVNNAGLARLRPVADTPVEDSLSQIMLNITALVRLTHAVLPAFKLRGQGTIINIASVLALHALPVSAVYSGTKGFVLNFSRGLQQELEGTGVRVQVVLPASTATEIWDQSGIPLAALDQQAVMSTDNLVDAALAGLAQGELVTLPSLHDAALWDSYDAARGTAFAATQTSKPAPRYTVA